MPGYMQDTCGFSYKCDSRAARSLSKPSCICEFGDSPRPLAVPLADAKGLLWYILEGFPLKNS